MRPYCLAYGTQHIYPVSLEQPLHVARTYAPYSLRRTTYQKVSHLSRDTESHETYPPKCTTHRSSIPPSTDVTPPAPPSPLTHRTEPTLSHTTRRNLKNEHDEKEHRHCDDVAVPRHGGNGVRRGELRRQTSGDILSRRGHR